VRAAKVVQSAQVFAQCAQTPRARPAQAAAMSKAPPPHRDSPGRLLDLELAALGALLGRPEPPAPNATPPDDPPASGDATSHPPATAPLRGTPP
jgi:hypothetical protein